MAITDDPDAGPTAMVRVTCTGHVRDAVGFHRDRFAFEGGTLRDFLSAFFAVYDVELLLIAETEAEATTRGWAPTPEELPGTWKANPEGEQTRRFARVLVDGTFNEHLAGWTRRSRTVTGLAAVPVHLLLLRWSHPLGSSSRV